MNTQIKLGKNSRRFQKNGVELAHTTFRLPVGLDLIIERMAEKNNTSKSVVVALMMTIALKAIGTWDLDFEDIKEMGSTIL